MAAQGKRIASGELDRKATHNAEENAGARYQGRRAAPKTRGIKLPVLSVPAIVRPIIGKPAVAASFVLASIVGVSATAVASNNSSNVADGQVVDLADAVDAAQEETTITVASNSADEAVMNAAEVLSDAAVLDSSDKKIAAATEKLQSLLDEIQGQAATETSASAADTTSDSRSTADSASRSFSRSTLSAGAEDSSDAVETVAESVPDADAESTTEADASAADSLADVSSSSTDAESLGITVRSVGSVDDVTTDNHSGSASEATSSESAVGTITNDYSAKHAAGGAHAADSDEEAPDSSQTANAVQAESTVVVPTDSETVDVAVDSQTIESVVAATEKLRSLVNGEGSVEVSSATEIAQTELEKTWAKANALTEKVGSYSNGQIPLSSLVELATAPGQYLRADAALMFGELNAAFKAQFGRNIKMTDSYRSYSVQVATKANKGWLAAAPGTSNHGWGLALDLSGPEAQWGTTERNWLVAHSEEYGWITPDWAQSSKPEPWHWEYAGATVSTVGSAAE